MTTLITRLSQAIEPTRELLEAVAALIWNITLPVSDWSALHWNKADRFTAMLDAEAWTSAVEMLVPEGWAWTLRSEGMAVLLSPNGPWEDVGQNADEACATPALALAIACLKARGLS